MASRPKSVVDAIQFARNQPVKLTESAFEAFALISTFTPMTIRNRRSLDASEDPLAEGYLSDLQGGM